MKYSVLKQKKITNGIWPVKRFRLNVYHILIDTHLYRLKNEFNGEFDHCLIICYQILIKLNW